jgi:hypothetical protein
MLVKQQGENYYMTSIMGVNINSAMYRDLKFAGGITASILICELALKMFGSTKTKRSMSDISMIKYFAIPASVIAIAAEYLLPGSAYR